MALHHLQLEERRPLHLPRRHPRQRLVQRPARETQRRRRHGRAEDIQHRHRDAKPLAWRAQQRRLRHPHIAEPQPPQRMRRDHLQPLDHLEARQARGHDEGRQPARPRRLAGAGENRVDIGDAAVRDPGLLAVQNVAVAVLGGGHAGIGHVRSGLGLGQRKGRDRPPGARPAQPVGTLRGRPEQRDRPGSQPLHGKGEIRQPVMARQRLADQAQAAHVQHTARRVDGRVPQEPRLAHRRHQRAAGRVDVGMIHRPQMRATPGLDLGRQDAVTVLEKGPAQETRVSHARASFIFPQVLPPEAGIRLRIPGKNRSTIFQSPWNTGCALATKAW